MRNLLVVVLSLWAATAAGQAVDSFPKVIYLDPYTAYIGYPFRNEAFAQLESLRITHIVGWGDAVTTNSKFKILANNSAITSVLGHPNNEVTVSGEYPYTLEKFTQQAHWVEMEAENDSLSKGYSFNDPQAIGRKNLPIPTLRSATPTVDQPGYLLKGPINGSVFYFTTKYLGVTDCQADYLLRIGDKTGDPEAVVAKLVVFNANRWQRWGTQETPVFTRDTVLCGDSIKVDSIGYVNGVPDWAKTYAFQRVLKVKDFADSATTAGGKWQSFKLCFYQTKDNPFRYQLYWTGAKTLFVDKVTVSNAQGRKLKEWNDNPALVQTPIQNYYNSLPKAPARWYLVDEPYAGQIPSLKHADKLVRSFRNSSQWPNDTVKFTTVWTPSWTGIGIAVYLDHVQPPELLTDWYPFACDVDSSSRKVVGEDFTNPQYRLNLLGADIQRVKAD